MKRLLILESIAISIVFTCIYSNQAIAKPDISKQVNNIRYQVCGDFPKWKRPTEQEQEAKLRSSSRYSGTPVDNGNWTHDAIIFDTFGSSLLQDVTVGSGLWKPLGGKLTCPIFSSERVVQINEKQIATIWLLNHKIKKIVWQGDRYIVSVTPSKTGIQFINFPRIERNDLVPISIITTDGVKVSTCSVQKC
jgi:hypothetical protein